LESVAVQQSGEQIPLGLKERRQADPRVGIGGEIVRDGVLQRLDDAEGIELMHLAQLARQ
jgi:hypothetical protein